VVLPGLLRLLQLHAGERVLDLACGQGAVSQGLHRAGADVTGVDLSPALIERARRYAPSIRFLVGDARHVDGLEDAAFDAVVCVLAAQNIDPIGPLFEEAARLLRPGGRAVFVVPHPAFRIPRQSRWSWHEERGILAREVDRYLTPMHIPIDMRPHRQPGKQTTWTYHRPMEDYVNGLSRAGLWTSAMEEWPSHKTSQPGPRAAAEDRAREDFPLFLALRSVRVPTEWRDGTRKA
jgi:SAM-dependent methyltransferase